jgi:PAS domain S-box-containing protein
LSGGVLVGYCLLNLARIGFSLTAAPANDLFRGGIFDSLLFLVYQILVVALTFSLVLMVNRRLHDELEADVEQRRLSDVAVRLSEARLTRAELASKAGNWELRLDTREVIGSLGAIKVYGVNADHLDYEVIREIPLPECRATLDSALVNLIQHDTPYDLEFRIRVPETGEIRDIHSIATFDRPSRTVFGIVQDVTARKKTELELDRHRAHLEELVAERTRELAAANERLRISEERFDYALQATSDGVWDWNLQSERAYANAAYRRMLGYGATDLAEDADSQFSNLLHPEERASVLAKTRQLLDDPGSYEIEFRMRCKDGSYKWILSRGMVVQRDRNGRPIRAVGTHVDLTSRKLTEIELREAKEIAESASRAKSTFLANMSHELRTPMNAIIGMTGLALRGNPEPKLRHQLGTIAEASDRLLGIINDILDISKIEAEHMTLEEVDFRLDEVFDKLLSLIGQRAADRGLQLEMEPAPGLASIPLRGDPMRLGQILLNLAGNAIKFADRGVIRLRCRSCGDGESETTLRFEVSDQGIGISPEDRKRLFSAFEQADGSTTRKYGGTGLGLVISKRLVEMMGGVIGVESVVGVGSTFWFTVVLRKGCDVAALEPVPLPGVDEARLRAEYPGARILLAEDEPINGEVSRMLLEAAGMVVDHAEDGAAAVALARRGTAGSTRTSGWTAWPGSSCWRASKQDSASAWARPCSAAPRRRATCWRQSAVVASAGPLIAHTSAGRRWTRAMTEVPDSAGTLVEVCNGMRSATRRTHVLFQRSARETEPSAMANCWPRRGKVAAGLRGRGVRAGDFVALMLPTGLEFFQSFYGILLAGAVPVPIYPPTRPGRSRTTCAARPASCRTARRSRC